MSGKRVIGWRVTVNPFGRLRYVMRAVHIPGGWKAVALAPGEAKPEPVVLADALWLRDRVKDWVDLNHWGPMAEAAPQVRVLRVVKGGAR